MRNFTQTIRRPARAVLLGAALTVVVAGTTACEPVQKGTVKVTVTYEGNPIDATVDVQGTLVTTGPDGIVEVPSYPGSRTVDARAKRAFPNDPLCWTTYESTGSPTVVVTPGTTTDVTFELVEGPSMCA